MAVGIVVSSSVVVVEDVISIGLFCTIFSFFGTGFLLPAYKIKNNNDKEIPMITQNLNGLFVFWDLENLLNIFLTNEVIKKMKPLRTQKVLIKELSEKIIATTNIPKPTKAIVLGELKFIFFII